jgi:hypothetical protein
MSEILVYKIGDVRWYLYPEYAEGLEPILKEIVEAEGLEKSARFRLVQEHPDGLSLHAVKASHPGLPVELWIKLARPRSIIDQLRLQRGASLLQREWEMSQVYQSRGLPIARYLALGKRFHNRRLFQEYLIQESLGIYQSFDQYYRYTFRPVLQSLRPFPEAGVEKKRGLIKELALLIRMMHEQGICRPGLGPSQILVASREQGVGLILTEPEKTRMSSRGRPSRAFGGAPSRALDPALSERVEALARLDANFSNLFNLSYRFRLFQEYFRPDKLDPDIFHGLVRAIITRSEELSQLRWREAERKIARREEPYYWFRTKEHRVFIKGPVYENSLIEVIHKLPEVVKKRESIHIKLIGSVRPHEAQVLFCPARPPAKNGWKSRAHQGMIMAAFLHERHLPHIEALAAVEARSRIRARRDPGYLIMQKPETGCLNLAEHLARRVADEFSGLLWDRTDLISLAHFLRRMHEMNMVYSPASGTDLWVRWSETKGREFLFSNPHHLQLRKPLSRQDAARHLAEFFSVLPISEADESMVLKEYLRFSRRFRDQRQAFLADFAKSSHRPGTSSGGQS